MLRARAPHRAVHATRPRSPHMLRARERTHAAAAHMQPHMRSSVHAPEPTSTSKCSEIDAGTRTPSARLPLVDPHSTALPLSPPPHALRVRPTHGRGPRCVRAGAGRCSAACEQCGAALGYLCGRSARGRTPGRRFASLTLSSCVLEVGQSRTNNAMQRARRRRARLYDLVGACHRCCYTRKNTAHTGVSVTRLPLTARTRGEFNKLSVHMGSGMTCDSWRQLVYRVSKQLESSRKHKAGWHPCWRPIF